MCILNLFEENQYAQASRALFIDTRMKKLRTVPGKKPRKAHTISITEGSITGRTPIYIGGRRNSPKPAWRRATPAPNTAMLRTIVLFSDALISSHAVWKKLF